MEKTYLQQVGERLFECRNRNLFSRKELAKRAGVSIETVKMMERGEGIVGIEDATKICNILNSSTEYILTGNCGLKELIRLNQNFLGLPNERSENLQKMAQAFWDTCPRTFR